ncbi:MAG: histone deacetylase family protein [Proteobacteria bacterium]|nr:histone deacetylase family protein [Pseudomonadota bacterium]
MFRLRRVLDDTQPRDREAIVQVQEILKSQFPGVSDEEIEGLPERLGDRLRHSFRYVLVVGDDVNGRVKGFALAAHAPDLKFFYLDFISTARRLTGGGIGGALYQHLRAEARALKTIGIFMECLPDDPALCRDADVLKQNRARLKFYEGFGGFPIVGTAYETPLIPGGDCPPYLVFDGLNREAPLGRKTARDVVRAILERKYGDVCPEGYIDMVVTSIRDNPVRLRPPRYVRPEAPGPGRSRPLKKNRIALVVNDRHEIHHVHERGYVEAPARIRSILKEFKKTAIFDPIKPRRFKERHIRAVHSPSLVDYLRRMCQKVEPGRSVYPYVFPIRNAARPPKELPVRAGYYCIDTFTPLNRNAFPAAHRAVECALTAAEALFAGYTLAYALVRPPGHHAERQVFGGFCYFNSGAIAAHHLSQYGRVAVLDIDYHHGNGTQDIFYRRADVLTVSIHGHPSFAYPYFSGFRDETGEGPGQGRNVNFPLPEHVTGPDYSRTLARALKIVSDFKPRFLVLALGLDTAKADPTGSWSLSAADFENNGRAIGALKMPTLVVQEGGYRVRSLGINARRFFTGLWLGAGMNE